MRIGALGGLLSATVMVTVAAAAPMARTFELRADSLTTNATAQTVTARGHVWVTDGIFVARAVAAQYAQRTRQLVLAGGVIVRSAEGLLRAREVTLSLNGNQQVQLITARGNVHVETRGRSISAQRVTYLPATGAATASGAITMIAPPDFRATGEDLIANLAHDVATLTGRARIQTAEGFLEGDRLDADGRSQTAVGRGRVIGTFRKVRLTADMATVWAREEKVVFRGHVKLVDPTRTLSADQVTLYYKAGRMVAEGATSVRVEDDRP